MKWLYKSFLFREMQKACATRPSACFVCDFKESLPERDKVQS